MKINNSYINRFTKSKSGYYYPVSKGIYLSFDKEGYYIGIEMFYIPKYNVDKYSDKTLRKLISLGYIE